MCYPPGVMKRNALALLLIATFLCGLVAGPHPCQGAPAGGRTEGMSGLPSCHAPAAGPAAGKNAMRAPDCCDVVCPHVCHMVAVLSIQPVLLNRAPLVPSSAGTIARAVLPPAFQIDHVPLA